MADFRHVIQLEAPGVSRPLPRPTPKPSPQPSGRAEAYDIERVIFAARCVARPWARRWRHAQRESRMPGARPTQSNNAAMPSMFADLGQTCWSSRGPGGLLAFPDSSEPGGVGCCLDWRSLQPMENQRISTNKTDLHPGTRRLPRPVGGMPASLADFHGRVQQKVGGGVAGQKAHALLFHLQRLRALIPIGQP
jgi:hypothetical protein